MNGIQKATIGSMQIYNFIYKNKIANNIIGINILIIKLQFSLA